MALGFIRFTLSFNLSPPLRLSSDREHSERVLFRLFFDSKQQVDPERNKD